MRRMLKDLRGGAESPAGGAERNWIVPPPVVQSPAKQTNGARASSPESPVRQTSRTNAITTRPWTQSTSTRMREEIWLAVS